MQVLESEDNRLRPCPSQDPSGHRTKLPSPQFFRLKIGGAVRRQLDVHERCDERRILSMVQADQPQSAFKVGETLFGRHIHTKTLPARFGHGVQRRILQQLRRRPLDPGVWSLACPQCRAGPAIFQNVG